MRYWIGVCTLAGVLCTPASFATEVEQALNLRQAIAWVIEHNPLLQAADFDHRAAAARVLQQGLGTPYEIGVDIENLAGSGDLSGIQGMETTLSLGRVLERGDKSQRRTELATVEAGVLRHSQDAQRLDLLAETARRFLRVARIQAERDLAQQRLDLMQQTLSSVEQRFNAGTIAAVERSRVQIEVARAELSLEETTHQRFNGLRDLAVMWGEFEPRFSSVEADLFKLEAEPEFAALDAQLERNPAIARLATEQRLSAARLALARTRAHADLDLRAGLRQLNASDEVGLMFSLRMPLGSTARAQSYQQEAEAQSAREPLLAQEQHLALRATLSGLHQELLHARDRYETYDAKIIPTAQQALSDYQQGYSAGRYSLLELSSAQNTLLEARSEALSAAVEHHAARIEIDRLIGAPIFTGVTP